MYEKDLIAFFRLRLCRKCNCVTCMCHWFVTTLHLNVNNSCDNRTLERSKSTREKVTRRECWTLNVLSGRFFKEWNSLSCFLSFPLNSQSDIFLARIFIVFAVVAVAIHLLFCSFAFSFALNFIDYYRNLFEMKYRHYNIFFYSLRRLFIAWCRRQMSKQIIGMRWIEVIFFLRWLCLLLVDAAVVGKSKNIELENIGSMCTRNFLLSLSRIVFPVSALHVFFANVFCHRIENTFGS